MSGFSYLKRCLSAYRSTDVSPRGTFSLCHYGNQCLFGVKLPLVDVRHFLLCASHVRHSCLPPVFAVRETVVNTRRFRAKNQFSHEMSYGRPPPRIDGMVSLKVDNLTYRTTPEDLRRVFERCGEVGDIYIPRDRFTRESRGFAFVR